MLNSINTKKNVKVKAKVKVEFLKLKGNIEGSIKFFEKRTIQTDGVHQKDRTGPGVNSNEAWSEAVKIIKGFGAILLQRIQTNSMSQTLGWFKNPVSSQTEKMMAGTKFSDYLGLNHYKKAKKIKHFIHLRLTYLPQSFGS